MNVPRRAQVAAVALSLALGACADHGGGGAHSSGSGATLGMSGAAAAVGGLQSGEGRGGGTQAALAGTLAGGYLGDRLGNRFDENARLAAAQAERQALSTGQPADWSDPQAGASGRVRPLRSFTDAAGRECREYSHTVTIRRKQESGTGIACREPDGNWTLVGS